MGLEASAWPPSPPHTLSHSGGMSLLTAFSSLIYGMGTVGSAHTVRVHNHHLTCGGKALCRNARQKPGAMILIQEWMGTPVLTARRCSRETAI